MAINRPLRVVSALINRNIAQSETAQSELAALEGRTLVVLVEGLPLTLALVAADGELHVSRQPVEAPAATLAGSPLSLLGILTDGAPDAQSLRERGLRLDGDQEVAAGFARLLRRARPELEEELSMLIGDLAARQIGNALRSLGGAGQRTLDTVRQNTSEFLQEESRIVPSRLEVRAFCDDVDQIRDDVERAAARLRRLHEAGSEDL